MAPWVESQDDIVRHPTCGRLIGTSQTVQAPYNFDVRRNYQTNKSLKSKHGSTGGGRRVWCTHPPPAALTTLSLLNQQVESGRWVCSHCVSVHWGTWRVDFTCSREELGSLTHSLHLNYWEVTPCGKQCRVTWRHCSNWYMIRLQPVMILEDKCC